MVPTTQGNEEIEMMMEIIKDVTTIKELVKTVLAQEESLTLFTPILMYLYLVDYKTSVDDIKSILQDALELDAE